MYLLHDDLTIDRLTRMCKFREFNLFIYVILFYFIRRSDVALYNFFTYYSTTIISNINVLFKIFSRSVSWSTLPSMEGYRSHSVDFEDSHLKCHKARLKLHRRHRMLEHIAGNILAFGRGHFKSERTSARAIWSIRTVKSTAVNTFDRESSVSIMILALTLQLLMLSYNAR